ncbi:MAG: hypothetical protein WC584_03040 [Candidatus Pacearchaeota archaeon]
MQKKGAKILSLFLVVMLGLVFVSGVVSATAWDNFKSWSNKVWEGWKSGASTIPEGDVFLKILIAIIITLMVFSILDAVGLIENRPALFIISLAVGIMGTYYMSVVQVKLLANIYTAFGGTLITLLPFIVLASFMIIAIRDGNVQMMVIQHIAWGIFSAFLLYTMFVKDVWNVVFWAIFFMSLALTFANSWALNWLASRILSAREIAVREGREEIEEGVDVLRGVGRRAGVRPRRGRRPW